MAHLRVLSIEKIIRKLFDKGTREEAPLQLMHFDICDPINKEARHGASYFITFIDGFTSFGHV